MRAYLDSPITCDRMRMRRIGVITLIGFFVVAMSVSLAFCTLGGGPRGEVAQPEAKQPTPPAPSVMPDLLGKSAREAARTLSGHPGGVYVSLAAVTVTYTVGPKKVSELDDPLRIEKFEIKARRVRLDSRLTRSSEQTITSQSVSAGSALSTATEIVLELGPHPGSSGVEPWMVSHPRGVKQNGADPCFECHQPTYCANCHTNVQM